MEVDRTIRGDEVELTYVDPHDVDLDINLPYGNSRPSRVVFRVVLRTVWILEMPMTEIAIRVLFGAVKDAKDADDIYITFDPEHEMFTRLTGVDPMFEVRLSFFRSLTAYGFRQMGVLALVKNVHDGMGLGNYPLNYRAPTYLPEREVAPVAYVPQPLLAYVPQPLQPHSPIYEPINGGRVKRRRRGSKRQRTGYVLSKSSRRVR